MRQQFQAVLQVSDEMRKRLAEAKCREVSEEELREQRISFAYGNALESPLITKESVRYAAARIRLCRDVEISVREAEDRKTSDS